MSLLKFYLLWYKMKQLAMVKSWTKLQPGADAINSSGLLNPKKLGNFKNWML